MASYAAVDGSVEVGDADTGDGGLDELLSEALDEALDADGRSPEQLKLVRTQSRRAEIADSTFAGMLPPPGWFAADGWRARAATHAVPAAVLMVAGGACPVVCAAARALCRPNGNDHEQLDKRVAAMLFALGLTAFWVCMVCQTLALPRLVAAGGPLAQLSLRNSGAAGFVDSGEPRLLAAQNLRELRWVQRVELVCSVSVCVWFIGVGSGSVLSGGEPGYLAGTTAEAFFPRPGCLSDTVLSALRWWMVLLYVPAGLMAVLFLHLCVLSQVLAVEFANQAIENVTTHLEFDRKLTSLADVTGALQEDGEPPRTLSSAIADDPEGWQDRVHTPLLSLVRLTLPLLSEWGPAIGAQTSGCLVLGMLTVPLCFATGGNPLLAVLVSLTTYPLLFLWGPAAVSDRCDKMLEHMNEVRADMAANAVTAAGAGSKVFALIRYASSYNKGQGIGFVMLGTTVDKRVLGKLFISAFAITPAIQMLVSIGQGNAELLELARELDEVEHNLTSAAAHGG